MTIKSYINKFKKAGIPIQIMLDINKPATVHAIDHERKIHVTEDDLLLAALIKMEEELLKGG